MLVMQMRLSFVKYRLVIYLLSYSLTYLLTKIVVIVNIIMFEADKTQLEHKKVII